MINFVCPACRKGYTVADEFAGRTTTCRACGQALRVPPAQVDCSKSGESKTEIGNTEPVCPYCNERLDKMPGRKKHCPACGRYMLVRTRPSDHRKILIREDQALQVEELWSIANGTHDQFLATRARYQADRDQLRMQLRREPTENEIRWKQLNDDLPQFAKHFQWGLYRNARLAMGDTLKKEGRYQDALDTYLEVCYIDLNGPNNTGADPAIIRFFPPFQPKSGSLAPGVVGYVEDMLGHQQLSKRDAEGKFLAVAAMVQQSLKLPVAPATAWRKLAKEIE